MPGAPESHTAGAAAGAENPSRDGSTFLVRKLGSAGVPTYLERVLTQDGEHRFVVVERLPRDDMTEDEASECVRDARTVAELEHPNVVRTRAISVRRDEISVTSDYVAGERLSELWSPVSGSGPTLPLEIALRILVDVSTGLGALHKLRSAEGQERIKFVHGEVTNANVLVGLDGVSALLRASRARRRNVLPKSGIGTLAPEVLSGGPADHRADVYSLGALLWQALSGQPLFPEDNVEAILASAQQGTAPRALVTKAPPWASALADVAARALAPAPDKRFPTASSMITEVRKIAGPKMATEEDVARFVEAAAGQKIAARLADLQASAVIRKATSITASRSSPGKAPAIAERGAEVAEPPSEALAIKPPEKVRPAAMVPAKGEAARPRAFPQLPDEPKVTPPSSARTKGARPQPFPQLPSEPKVSSPVPPKAEASRAQASPEVPPDPPTLVRPAAAEPPPKPPALVAPAAGELSPDPPTLVRPPAGASGRSNPSPPPPTKPIATPKRTTVKREGAAAEGSAVAVKAVPAVAAVAPARSLLGRPGARWAIGVYTAIAFVTGWLTLQAIRDRQEIATPGAASVDTTPMPAPATSTVRIEPTGTARPGVVSPVTAKPAPAATSTTMGRVAKPPASIKAPPPNPPRK